MPYFTAFSALVTMFIFLRCGNIKFKYFQKGTYRDISLMRLGKLNKAIKAGETKEDIGELKRLRALYMTGVCFLFLTATLVIIWIATEIKS